MVEEDGVRIQSVTKALTGRPLCVLNTVEGNDARIKAVKRALKEAPLCVSRTVEEDDVPTQSVTKALKEAPLCVLRTVEAHDAPIASHGLTLEVVEASMMAFVLPVSSTSFQRTREARSCMPIPKRSVFVMRSMNSLKGSSMIGLSIQVIVTAL